MGGARLHLLEARARFREIPKLSPLMTLPSELTVLIAALATGFGILSLLLWRELQRKRHLHDEDIRRLSTSESRYRTLVESPNLGVILMELDGRILYVSPKIEELTGYTPAEFYGKRRMPWRITHREDHPIGVKAFRQAANGTPAPRQEFRLMHKNGEYRWAAGSTFPVYDADEIIRSVQVIVEDITTSKRLEEQLRHSQKMEAVGQLSAGIAHNFNNMLQGIQGSLDLATEASGSEAKDYLEGAAGMARRAAAIVKQLVLFARPGKEALKAFVNVPAVIANVNQVCSTAFDRNIGMRITIADSLPTVLGDATQIEQALLNLCLNARDALAEHPSPSIRIEVDLCAIPADRPYPPPGTRPGSYLRFAVRDEGIGMSRETQSRVFEPFFTTRELGKGTGLGLSTAYGIVRQHGGWIDCDSVPGVGTTFTVYLPASEPGKAEPAPPSREVAEEIPRGSETILVIEDEERIRRTVSKMLAQCGYNVLLSADGEEGLEVFGRERENIDLVLLDLSMPKLSGEQTLIELTALDDSARVVIFTGRSAEADGLPVKDVIHKPVTMQELASAVRRNLDS